MTNRYRLADRAARVPLPDRGLGVFFSSSDEGEALDPVNPWHARLIAEGSVVAIADPVETAPTSAPAVRSSTPAPKGA